VAHAGVDHMRSAGAVQQGVIQLAATGTTPTDAALALSPLPQAILPMQRRQAQHQDHEFKIFPHPAAAGHRRRPGRQRDHPDGQPFRHGPQHHPWHQFVHSGAGASRRISAVRWGVAFNILIAWVITLPASAAVAWVTMKGLALIA